MRGDSVFGGPVEESAGVSIGENEAITIEPIGNTGIKIHELTPEQVGHGSASHWGSWVARVSLLNDIRCQDSNISNAFLSEHRVHSGLAFHSHPLGESLQSRGGHFSLFEHSQATKSAVKYFCGSTKHCKLHGSTTANTRIQAWKRSLE